LRSGHRTIAIVDDERRVLESLQNLLESAGYQVLLFESALPLLSDGNLNIVDCVISDVHMVPVGGKELLRLLQAELPNLPVILITGRESGESESDFINMGARFFFKKPLKSRELLDAIAVCLT
jgi:FixJ family two-component response regulator